MSTGAESFIGFVDGLDPREDNAKGLMRDMFTWARYSDLSTELGSLPDALARAIAASDTEALTRIAEVLGDLTGEYEGHIELG